jgi:hypothetical protein
MSDPLDFIFEVDTSLHDDVKQGILTSVRSRVVISDHDFPDPRVAAQVAGCMAVAIHGGMPTRITRLQ